jgi:hypothetical protein
MKLNNYFNFSRFWLLLKMEWSRSRKGLLMTLGIIFGSMFIMGLLLTPLFEPDMKEFEYGGGFTFTLLIGGFILSSMAYRDLGNPLRRHNFLTLPVSTFERFLSMWLLTSPGWIILYTLIYSIYAPFATAIGQLLYDHLHFVPFSPLAPKTISAILYYFVLQGIFLAGAAHFRGYPLPKTMLVLIILGAIGGLIMYFIMHDYFEFDLGEDPNPFAGMPSDTLFTVMKLLFWWVLAPLSWVIAYLGLKEQEV